MYDKLIIMLNEEIENTDWNDLSHGERARAIFTTMCLYFNWCPLIGTFADGMLEAKYQKYVFGKYHISYKQFESYMTEFIGG